MFLLQCRRQTKQTKLTNSRSIKASSAHALQPHPHAPLQGERGVKCWINNSYRGIIVRPLRAAPLPGTFPGGPLPGGPLPSADNMATFNSQMLRRTLCRVRPLWPSATNRHYNTSADTTIITYKGCGRPQGPHPATNRQHMLDKQLRAVVS